MNYIDNINSIQNKIILELDTIDSLEKLEELRIKYFGKKGIVTNMNSIIKDLSLEDKKIFGASLNDLKNTFNEKYGKVKNRLTNIGLEKKILTEKIDITLPGSEFNPGTRHILNKIIEEIEDIFISMGYDVVFGPEVELDTYNFEYLNIPKNHPARDSQDSFYIDDNTVLRTHTSPVQVRTMLKNANKEPIRVICPGKVYRRDDDDATHSHQFTQVEGLLVDKDISMSHLKGTLEHFVKKIFGNNVNLRFRPNFFPFTEPSFEVDISCFKCNQAGCNVCKHTGYIEILGSGMVHPNVLRNAGYDPDIYTGFAFGIGVERIAMLKHKVSDIREFYTNDLRFIEQFDRKVSDSNENQL